MIIQSNIGMKGFFRIQIRRPDGRVRFDSGFFPNTILNDGRNVMATRSDWTTYCQVGTGTTFPPDINDRRNETALEAHHAGSNTLSGSILRGQAGVAPYFGWMRKTFRFGAGTVAANLSEVGVGWGASGSTLISRAQILDPTSGLPTTVTPLIDELLDVTYELRYYAPTVDVVGPQVTLNGELFDVTTRAASVTGQYWSDGIGSAIGVQTPAALYIAYTGNIGAITSTPSGTSGANTTGSLTNASYSNNSYEIGLNCVVPSIEWNVGGIRSILIRTTAGAYQSEFSRVSDAAAIPKTSSFTMIMRWKLGWVEYV